MNPLNPLCCPPEKARVQTVQSVSGIKGLNNCFVHVIDNNTVYYVDNKHHITEICVGIVEVRDYNFDTNPLGLRNQVVYDTKQQTLFYMDNAGQSHPFDPNADIDFNRLLNRPTYGGQVMNSDTNIPKVPTEIDDLSDGQRVTDLENQVKDLEAGTSTVALWTVDEPGSIKSGSGDGEVAAQTNGTGKVVGWDEQAAAITELQNTSNEYAQSLNQIELDISNLQEEVADLPTGESGGVKLAYFFTMPLIASPYYQLTNSSYDFPDFQFDLLPNHRYYMVATANLQNTNGFPICATLYFHPKSASRVYATIDGIKSHVDGTQSALVEGTLVYDPGMYGTGTPQATSLGLSLSCGRWENGSIPAANSLAIFYAQAMVIDLGEVPTASTEEPTE